MTNIARPLTDERELLEAETRLGTEERKAWERLERALVDPHEGAGSELATRLARLASHPDAPAALVAQAREYAMPAFPTAAPGGTERELALTARRGALQARELAVRAIERDVVVFEDLHARRAKALSELRTLVDGIEKAAEDARRARAAEEAKAQAEREALARKAEEEARKASALAPEPTVPEVPVFDPGTTLPGTPAFARTEKPAPTEPISVVTTAPVAETAPFMPVSAPSASPEAKTAAARKRGGRKRRVRLAPPPGQLNVDVAEHGDDTFYTGWNRTIADGGLFVVSLETLPPGHELDVEINLDGQTIRSRGRVQFNRRVNPTNPDCQAGAGIKLLNLTRENTQTIESFFADREPLFFIER